MLSQIYCFISLFLPYTLPDIADRLTTHCEYFNEHHREVMSWQTDFIHHVPIVSYCMVKV